MKSNNKSSIDNQLKQDRGIIIVLIIFLTAMTLIFGAMFFLTDSWSADGLPMITGVNRGQVIGGIRPIKLTSNETLSGACLWGTYITGASRIDRTFGHAGGGVTATLSSSTGEGENIVFYVGDDTSETGNSLYVMTPVGDNIVSADGEDVKAGVSHVNLTGTTMAHIVTFLGTGLSEWTIVSKETLETD